MVIDGAGYLRIIWSLRLPLSAPPTISIFILIWLAEWSGLLKPMLFTTFQERYSLQVGLNFLNRGAQVTTLTISMFIIRQRRFVEGIAQTDLKG